MYHSSRVYHQNIEDKRRTAVSRMKKVKHDGRQGQHRNDPTIILKKSNVFIRLLMLINYDNFQTIKITSSIKRIFHLSHIKTIAKLNI